MPPCVSQAQSKSTSSLHRRIAVDAARFDFRIGRGPVTKMMHEFRQFAPTKQGVSFSTNLCHFLRHDTLRQFVGAEHERKYLDG